VLPHPFPHRRRLFHCTAAVCPTLPCDPSSEGRKEKDAQWTPSPIKGTPFSPIRSLSSLIHKYHKLS
jgi:hypothetical protein